MIEETLSELGRETTKPLETRREKRDRKRESDLEIDIGLLFTNKSREEVVEWFENFQEADYARSGNIASKTVVVKEGPLKDFSHALEPQLRKLGLPTSLQKGVVTLMGDYTVCRAGDVLTPEQARVLKMFNIPMADFHIKLLSVWANGEYEQLATPDEEGAAEGGDDDEEEDAMDS